MVTYEYDNQPHAKGKLTRVSSSVSENQFTSFDILGRVLSSVQVTDGRNYAQNYTYNLSGALVEQEYPSFRKVKSILNNNGSLALVESKKNATSGYWTYANSFAYTPAGAVSLLQVGNGHWESASFNSRLQATTIALGSTPNAIDLLKLDYSYGANQNNGNVQSQTITVPVPGSNAVTFTQSYQYDSLNRIKQATETSANQPGWQQTFVYDRYGNRRFDTSQNRTTTLTPNCPAAVCNPEISQSNNKLVGAIYDSSGNTTVDGSLQKYIYDGENRIVAAKDASGNLIGQYWYDGDGKRVKKYVPSTDEVTVFVYDAGGKIVEEYSTKLSDAPQLAYVTNDSLGSPRINTNAYGAVIARHDYHPFGEEITGDGRTSGIGYDADEIRKKFTGYERDEETNLDFAQARMYDRDKGRFITPDSLLSSGRVENPQTWNRYNYVLGNPLRYSDPLGLFEWDESAGGNATDAELLSQSKDKSLTKKDRRNARRALKFRGNFRSAREQDLRAANSSVLSDEQKTGITTAVGSYGDENDHNGVVVAVKSKLASGAGATTVLRDDGTTLVSFRAGSSGASLAIEVAHEGQHVADIDTYLSNRDKDGETDLTHYQRETRAYEITSFVAQGLGQGSAIKGFDAKYQVWNKGWKSSEIAQNRAKAIDLLISNYEPYNKKDPGNKYSQEFNPQR
jgi:RHS repeat-associated protein